MVKGRCSGTIQIKYVMLVNFKKHGMCQNVGPTISLLECWGKPQAMEKQRHVLKNHRDHAVYSEAREVQSRIIRQRLPPPQVFQNLGSEHAGG